MADFFWEALGQNGETRKGTMKAANQDEVLNKLRSQQLQPVKVKKKPTEFHIQLGTGIDVKDQVVFTRQLATMIDAGLPIVQSLEILGSQSENFAMRKLIGEVKQTVEGGSTFSEALKKHPKVFDELYVNLVAAGEMGGILDTILNRLAIHLEKRAKLRRQVSGAMVYPSAVVVIACGVVGILLGYVIPTFQKMFASMGANNQLPGPTQFVVDLSEGFLSNIWLILGAITAIIVSFIVIYKTPQGKEIIHKLLLVIPILGPVLRKVAVARFVRTLGTLLSSGVPILDSLDIVAKSAGNVVVEKGINFVRQKISEGRNLAEPLQETKIFPGMVVQMIAVGEQTGSLDQMCNKIADFYEEEVDTAIAALMSMLEPLMMVVIGGIVGGLMIAMYLPIFDIAGKVDQGGG